MIVDVASVEQELARIQRELTSSEVRASLFNLVVFSSDVDRAMTDVSLNYLLGKRAARVIHIAGADSAESSLDVSARCFIDAEKKSVCFQEIIIINGTDGAGAAPGSWVPLLVRGLPTFILWMDSLGDKRELLMHAREQADKLLVDMQNLVALGEDEEATLEAVREIALSGGIPVSDFTFGRLKPVQKIIAMVFDDPERTPLLERITAVHLNGSTRISGRLLLLWLADRLGWTVENVDASGAAFTDRRGNSIVFRHETNDDSLPQEMQIEFDAGEPVTINFLQNGCADVDCPEGSQIHPVVEPLTRGELLLEEVDKISGDWLFRRALEASLGGGSPSP